MELPQSEREVQGTVHAINLSRGGVPKRAVEDVEVLHTGLVGDRQANRQYHGGPDRAVCLLGLDVIEALRARGHPIAPGTVGENLTLAGVDWSRLQLGSRLHFDGGLELEVTSWAVPCKQIAGSFHDGNSTRLHVDRHPGQARAYTRVLKIGRLSVGTSFRVRDPQV